LASLGLGPLGLGPLGLYGLFQMHVCTIHEDEARGS
jgi:hypothetical protein